jgi:hypothetical protein
MIRCTRCNKRLSRKTARMIDGKVLCSPCVFGQAPRDSGSGPEGRRPVGAPGEAPQSGGEAASPIPDHPETPHD